jgi:hypothetical protein
VAWLIPVLAERAHWTDRILRMAVLLHARTLGPIQAALKIETSKLGGIIYSGARRCAQWETNQPSAQEQDADGAWRSINEQQQESHLSVYPP